jgi:ribosomal protein S12 methylthiotransferase accessory factor
MTTSLLKAYTAGTHRLLSPVDTLRLIEGQMQHVGVTRCADVTGLDYLNIPVFCAIRPLGRLLQVANGKGLDATSAKVSALMEAVEFYYYERASENSYRASLASMRSMGRVAIEPEVLAQYRHSCFFTPNYLIDWVPGEDLITGEEVWLPGSSAGIRKPMLYPFSSNGLASGNHLIEASLHGLYELIERDSISRLSRNGRIRFEAPDCFCID